MQEISEHKISKHVTLDKEKTLKITKARFMKNGVSFMSFCNSVSDINLNTIMYGCTWNLSEDKAVVYYNKNLYIRDGNKCVIFKFHDFCNKYWCEIEEGEHVDLCCTKLLFSDNNAKIAFIFRVKGRPTKKLKRLFKMKFFNGFAYGTIYIDAFKPTETPIDMLINVKRNDINLGDDKLAQQLALNNYSASEYTKACYLYYGFQDIYNVYSIKNRVVEDYALSTNYEPFKQEEVEGWKGVDVGITNLFVYRDNDKKAYLFNNNSKTMKLVKKIPVPQIRPFPLNKH